MYKVIHPQPLPKYDDISFWELREYLGLGIGIAANGAGDGFIPFPSDESPIGVKVIKRNYLWFWSRPRYYNPNNPITDVVATLGPLKIFSDHQLKIIAGCLNYTDNDPPELEGHQNNMLVSNLYTLLALALDQLSEQRVTDLVEVFRCVTGGGPDHV